MHLENPLLSDLNKSFPYFCLNSQKISSLCLGAGHPTGNVLACPANEPSGLPPSIQIHPLSYFLTYISSTSSYTYFLSLQLYLSRFTFFFLTYITSIHFLSIHLCYLFRFDLFPIFSPTSLQPFPDLFTSIIFSFLTNNHSLKQEKKDKYTKLHYPRVQIWPYVL